MNERVKHLSSAVDCLTAAIELEDDSRLREARELVLTVAWEVDDTSEVPTPITAQGDVPF